MGNKVFLDGAGLVKPQDKKWEIKELCSTPQNGHTKSSRGDFGTHLTSQFVPSTTQPPSCPVCKCVLSRVCHRGDNSVIIQMDDTHFKQMAT